MFHHTPFLPLFIGLSVLLFMPTGAVNAQQTTCTIFSHNLYRGLTDYTSNGDVSRLQAFLLQEGYFPYQPVGIFGPITFQSVQNFQAHNGIPATGYVGPITRGAIEQLTCQGGQGTLPVAGIYLQSISATAGMPGSIVTVYGSGFTASNAVILGGNLISYIPSYDGRTFSFAVPNLSPGTYTFYIQNADGTSNALSFTITSSSFFYYQTPSIQSLSPVSGPAGTQVIVYGSEFTSNNTVIFDGITLLTNYINANMLSFTVPTLSPGSYTLSVQNSNGTSNSSTFTVTTFQSLSPIVIQNSGSTNTSPYTITINTDGSGTLSVNNMASNQFSAGTFGYQTLVSDIQAVPSLGFSSSCMKSASFGTTVTVTFNGQTSGDISCPPPGQSYQTLETAVDNAVQQACSSNTCSGRTTTVIPTISSITPTTVAPGGTVTLFGSNFDQYTYIALDGSYGQSITPTLLSATSLSFVVPTSIPTGTHSVQVGETQASIFSLSNSVTVTVVAPVISLPSCTLSASPSSVSSGGVYTLFWTSTDATSQSIVGPNGITIAPAPGTTSGSEQFSPTGYWTMTVSNAQGTQTCQTSVATATTTSSAPTISSLSPTSGPAGTIVTIQGSGFTANNSVLVSGPVSGAIAAHVVASNDGTMLTFTFPSTVGPNCFNQQLCPDWIRYLSVGTYSLSIENINGTSNAQSFTYTGGLF